MLSAIQKRAQSFSLSFGGVAIVGIIWATTMQPILNLIDPILCAIVGMSFALTAFAAYEFIVRAEKTVAVVIMGVVGLTIGIFASYLVYQQASARTEFVRDACIRMQTELLAKPDGDTAETFGALGCHVRSDYQIWGFDFG